MITNLWDLILSSRGMIATLGIDSGPSKLGSEWPSGKMNERDSQGTGSNPARVGASRRSGGLPELESSFRFQYLSIFHKSPCKSGI